MSAGNKANKKEMAKNGLRNAIRMLYTCDEIDSKTLDLYREWIRDSMVVCAIADCELDEIVGVIAEEILAFRLGEEGIVEGKGNNGKKIQ